jgi:hypothetical protein
MPRLRTPSAASLTNLVFPTPRPASNHDAGAAAARYPAEDLRQLAGCWLVVSGSGRCAWIW